MKGALTMVPTPMITNRMRRSGFVVAALVLSAAVWFGVRLGPRSDVPDPSRATPESARWAADGFVRRMVEQRGGGVRTLQCDSTDRDGLYWTLSGTATAKLRDRPAPERIHWATRQVWDNTGWRLKELTVTSAAQTRQKTSDKKEKSPGSD
ncbi:MAG: hypothetical protein V4671_19540 [Armatimonadota bacterium]